MPATNFQVRRVALIDISESTTVSNAIDVRGVSMGGLLIPSNFDGTIITFQVSDDQNGTFVAAYKDDNTQYSMTTAASRFTTFDDAAVMLAAASWIKLVTTTAQTTTDTSITFLGKD
jgi:hypothetical protein